LGPTAVLLSSEFPDSLLLLWEIVWWAGLQGMVGGASKPQHCCTVLYTGKKYSLTPTTQYLSLRCEKLAGATTVNQKGIFPLAESWRAERRQKEDG
jgi:hypothetical protein